MKATIIIPLYNTEDFIERAILSAVNQGVTPPPPTSRYELEVLVVDDGSTDNSLAVAQQLATKYSQVKVFSKQNEGASTARNYGLDRATGDYIFFLDSDDYFFPDSVGRAVQLMEADDLDLLSCDYSGIDPQGEYVFIGHKANLEPTKVMSGRDYLRFKEHHSAHAPMVWAYVYTREFISKNNLRMIPFCVHEDVDFVARALLLAQRMRYEPISVVYYYQRNSSITNDYKPKYLLDLIRILGRISSFVKDNFQNDKEISAFFTKYISDMAFGATRVSVKQGHGVDMEAVNLSKEVGIYPFDNTEFSFKRALINRNPNLFFSLYRAAKRKPRK